MKFIIYGPTFQASDMMFDSIKKNHNVYYNNFPIKNKLLYLLLRVHINRLNFLPGKKIWKNIFSCFPDKLEENQNCYIYGNPWALFMYETGFISKLKQKDKRSMHVAYLSDINSAKNMPLNDMKKIFDKIYIFDMDVARSLKIDFYPLMFSPNIPKNEKIEYDLIFIGQGKGRELLLKQIFTEIKQRNLKGKCILTNCKINKNENGIEYRKDSLDAKTALDYVMKTKCLLELKSDGVQALSDRVTKAVVLNKKILTNNSSIMTHKYYNSNNMQFFDCVNNINWEFLEEELDDYHYDGEYSAENFLVYLEKNYNRYKI